GRGLVMPRVSFRELERFGRTLKSLHPLQILARPPREVVRRLLSDVPALRAPEVLSSWPVAAPELVNLWRSEAARAASRIRRLPTGSLLQAYERAYGLELGDPASPGPIWSGAIAVNPFPASVRARSIAVATRLGRRDLESQLARACRAVLLQPELHLL